MLTTISDIATETIHRTAGLGWIPELDERPYYRAIGQLPRVTTDELLTLDGPGWGRLFADYDVDRQLVLQLDRRGHGEFFEHRKLRTLPETRTGNPRPLPSRGVGKWELQETTGARHGALQTRPRTPIHRYENPCSRGG